MKQMCARAKKVEDERAASMRKQQQANQKDAATCMML
jgi:hypothetical protein